MGCSVEVLVLYAKELEKVDEIVIDLSNELITQFERKFGPRTGNDEVISYVGAREYTKHMQPNQIREIHIVVAVTRR